MSPKAFVLAVALLVNLSGGAQEAPKAPPAAPDAGAGNPAPPITAAAPALPIPRVPAGFRSAAGAKPEPYTNTGWAQGVVHERTGMAFAYIPAGVFECTESREGERDERSPAGFPHQVTLTRGFYLGKYEVTQAQWETVMRDNPSSFKGRDNPVESISWNDCQEFIKKLNATLPPPPREQGQAPIGFRLPTEAEWEYACRAGTTEDFHYGERLDASQANFDASQRFTHPWEVPQAEWYTQTTVSVGSFEPNARDLYDMHGNVWEWCSDWYGDYPAGAVTDPTGPGVGQYRVSRGGGWFSEATFCRSANRDWLPPEFRNGDLGCRLAYDPPAAPPEAAPDAKVLAPAGPVPVPGAAGAAPAP